MYGIGFLFFVVTFAVNKFLLVFYYTKSESVFDPTFARDVFFSLRFLIIFKMLFGILNFCNPKITATQFEPRQDIPLKVNLTETFGYLNEELGR